MVSFRCVDTICPNLLLETLVRLQSENISISMWIEKAELTILVLNVQLDLEQLNLVLFVFLSTSSAMNRKGAAHVI